ncbi:unnamed protein product, partial [Urochloa humidicola]
SPSILCDSYSVEPEVRQEQNMFSAARLKKKEVQQNNSKRHRSWPDKTRKYTKKVPNESGQKESGGAGVETQVPTQVHEHNNVFTSFTDLLTGPSEIDDMLVQDLL